MTSAAQAHLAPFVYNRIKEYTEQFKAIFLVRQRPEKHFQEWMKHERDAFVYATVCCLGYIQTNGDEVICAHSSANCIHTILTTPASGVMHMKMVPYENTLDDIRVDAVVGKMISIITARDPDFQPYKENFLQYFCSANMYVKKNDLRIPYKKLFKTNERCSSILFDNINPVSSPETQGFSGKEGYFKKEYMYTKCIVNKAIHGHNLGFYIKNAPDDWFVEFLKGDKLWKMCKGMHELGTTWGFVHNDAHTGNVIVDDASGELVLIDYGRSYINLKKEGADAEAIILKQENIKHEITDTDAADDVFGNFSYIKSDGAVVTETNLADSLPVMCDIACLSYNIWKRVCAMTIPGELDRVVEAMKQILKFEGQTIKFTDPPPLPDLTTSLRNMRVIAAGLLWMRCYIKTAWDQVGYMDTDIKTTDIEGTVHAPDKILWNAGQINPSVYNAMTGSLNTCLNNNKMNDWIDNAFDSQDGGGPTSLDANDDNTTSFRPFEIATLSDEDKRKMVSTMEYGSKLPTSRSPAGAEKYMSDADFERQIVSEYENGLPKPIPITSTMKRLSSPAKAAEADLSLAKKKFTFADIKLPQITYNYKEYTALDKAQMLKNYAGYHQHSTAFAQECMDKIARERGNFC